MKRTLYCIVFALFFVSVLTFSFPADVEAGKTGAYINGPTHVRVGKEYTYTVSCRDLSAEYIEVYATQRITDPRIVIGDGSLVYDLDMFPGFISWHGDKSENVKLKFDIDPAFSTAGEYTFTIAVDCIGESEYDTATMLVVVSP